MEDPLKLFPSLLCGLALEVKNSNDKKSDFDKIISSKASTFYLSADDQVRINQHKTNPII